MPMLAGASASRCAVRRLRAAHQLARTQWARHSVRGCCASGQVRWHTRRAFMGSSQGQRRRALSSRRWCPMHVIKVFLSMSPSPAPPQAIRGDTRRMPRGVRFDRVRRHRRAGGDAQPMRCRASMCWGKVEHSSDEWLWRRATRPKQVDAVQVCKPRAHEARAPGLNYIIICPFD
jgi:hypothetical protein